MKLTSNQITTAISIARSAIGNEKTMPILAHVLIETGDGEITMTGSDLQTEIKTTCQADIKQPGRACINSFVLDAFSKNAGEFPITINCNGHNAHLKARGRSKINILSAEDYPSMPVQSAEKQAVMMVEAKDLSNAINMIEHCAGRHDVRAYLNSILLQNREHEITLVSSDGHQLATTHFLALEQSCEPFDCIIPIKAATTIAKLFRSGNINLTFNRNQMRVNDGKTTLTCKAIDGKFPEFNDVFNKNMSFETEIDSASFISCLETASITAGIQTKGVSLKFTESNITVESQNAQGEESTDSAECTHQGGELTLGFNATYLINAAKKIDGMMFLASDGERQLTLQPRNCSVTYLIMSMKL